MIKVSLGDLILIGMALGVTLVCLLWLIAVFHERRKHRRVSISTNLCRICGCAYPGPPTTDITICPACGAANEHNALEPI